jgi:hypothetical protein
LLLSLDAKYNFDHAGLGRSDRFKFRHPSPGPHQVSLLLQWEYTLGKSFVGCRTRT